MEGIDSTWTECELVDLQEDLGDFLISQIKGADEIEIVPAGNDFFVVAFFDDGSNQVLYYNETAKKYTQMSFDNSYLLVCNNYTAVKYPDSEISFATICTQYNSNLVIFKMHDQITESDYFKLDSFIEEPDIVKLSPLYKNVLFVKTGLAIQVFRITEGTSIALMSIKVECPEKDVSICDTFEFEVIDDKIVVVLMRASFKVEEIQIFQIDQEELKWARVIQKYSVSLFCEDRLNLKYNRIEKVLSKLLLLSLDCILDEGTPQKKLYFFNLENPGSVNPYYSTESMAEHSSIACLTKSYDDEFRQNVVYIVSRYNTLEENYIVLTRVFQEIYVQTEQFISEIEKAGELKASVEFTMELKFQNKLKKPRVFKFHTTLNNDFSTIVSLETKENTTLDLNLFRNTSENFFEFFLDISSFYMGNIYNYSLACQVDDECDPKEPYVVIEPPVQLLKSIENGNLQKEKLSRFVNSSSYFLIGEVLEIYNSDLSEEAQEYLYLPIVSGNQEDYIIPDCSRFLIFGDSYVFICGHEKFTILAYDKEGKLSSATQFDTFSSYCAQKVLYYELVADNFFLLICYNAPFDLLLEPSFGVFELEVKSSKINVKMIYKLPDDIGEHMSIVASQDNSKINYFFIFFLTKYSSIEVREISLPTNGFQITSKFIGEFFVSEIIDPIYKKGLEKQPLTQIVNIPDTYSILVNTKHFFSFLLFFNTTTYTFQVKDYICPFRFMESQWARVFQNILVVNERDMRTKNDNLVFYNTSKSLDGYLYSYQLINITNITGSIGFHQVKDVFFTSREVLKNGEKVKTNRIYAVLDQMSTDSKEKERSIILQFNMTTNINVKFLYNLVNSKTVEVFAENRADSVEKAGHNFSVIPYEYTNEEIVMQAGYIFGLCLFAILIIGWFFIDNLRKQRREKRKARERAEAEKIMSENEDSEQKQEKEGGFEMARMIQKSNMGPAQRVQSEKGILAAIGKVNEKTNDIEKNKKEASQRPV